MVTLLEQIRANYLLAARRPVGNNLAMSIGNAACPAAVRLNFNKFLHINQRVYSIKQACRLVLISYRHLRFNLQPHVNKSDNFCSEYETAPD